MPPIHALVRAGGLTLMGLMPIWVRPKSNHPVLWAFIPVLVTYATAALGGAFLMEWTRGESGEALGPDARDVVSLWASAATATAVHMLIAAVVYMFSWISRDVRNDSGWGCLVFIFTLFWFGLPILALAQRTSPLTLIAAAIHLIFAKSQERHWVFVEYGSTSFALCLFVLNFGGANTWVALPIVVFQALMLTLLAVWGRNLVLSEEPEPERLQRPPVKLANPSPARSVPVEGKRRRRKRRRKR